MKRIFSLVLLIIISFSMLVSCEKKPNDPHFGHDHSTMPVTFIDGDSSKQIDIMKEHYYIDVYDSVNYEKSGYICCGYFTEENGQGEQIFDSYGTIRKGYCFTDDSPSVLYSCWKSIDQISLTVTDNQETYFGSAVAYLREKINFSDEIKKAAKENPNEKIKITVSFDAKGAGTGGVFNSEVEDANPVTIGIGKDYYKWNSYKKSSFTLTGSYTRYTFTTEVSASEISDSFYVVCNFYDAGLYMYRKNFTCTISFA